MKYFVSQYAYSDAVMTRFFSSNTHLTHISTNMRVSALATRSLLASCARLVSLDIQCGVELFNAASLLTCQCSLDSLVSLELHHSSSDHRSLHTTADYRVLRVLLERAAHLRSLVICTPVDQVAQVFANDLQIVAPLRLLQLVGLSSLCDEAIEILGHQLGATLETLKLDRCDQLTSSGTIARSEALSECQTLAVETVNAIESSNFTVN